MPPSSRRSTILNLVVPLLAFVTATVLTLALWDDFFHRLPYPLYIAAIAVSAWYSGWVAGVGVAVAGIVTVNASQPSDPPLLTASVLLLVISAVISYLAEFHRRGLGAARQSEERYRLVNRVTNDVIWDWDLKTGQLDWNDSLEQVHGHRPDEVTNTIGWWPEHIHPNDRKRVANGIQAVIDSDQQTAWQDEYRFRRSDGTFAEVLDRGYLHRDQKGRPVRMIGSMLDLTERKQAEEAVRESEAHVRRVLDSLFGFVGVLRLDGTLIKANRAPLEAAGLSADEVLGKKFWDCYWWNCSAIDICQREASARMVVDLAAGNPIVRGDSTRLRQVFWNLIGNAMKFTPPEGTITVRSVDAPDGRWGSCSPVNVW